ncbi:hypothetical protein N4G70_31970 [Streptomyces sp. ASQP_92]|uniref:hypothetical protein n=1 Tax=Streptomyces sp. ASQP_92 TaxID=2979116 RepID=UPI0021C0A2F6|nr:hypothetical protein [Streptomyces sp. ASQP_92]MCT9093452.1 hypothetical protein [Streptomyces sp. ASQP_92]
MPSASSPYTTIEEWEEAAATQRAAARGVARLIADTLRRQFAGAAYLVLYLAPEHDRATRLFPHSVRDVGGTILHDFEDHLMPPVGHGTAISAAWGDLSPRDPFDLRRILRCLDTTGAVFDNYPEDLRTDDDPAETTMPCLLLHATARPAPFHDENDADASGRLLRPHSPLSFAEHGRADRDD